MAKSWSFQQQTQMHKLKCREQQEEHKDPLGKVFEMTAETVLAKHREIPW
jgi:hypothetical protein